MKKFLPHAIVICVLLAICAVFFSPVVFGDKTLRQGDIEKCDGMKQEIKTYQEATSKGTAWTGSMFSGMPTYTIAQPIGPDNVIKTFFTHVVMFMDYQSAGSIFLAMLAMYIALCCMDIKPLISALGAIAYGLSSYYPIIIAAGHVTKSWAMDYMPLVIAGLLLLFKGKKLWGFIVFTVGLTLEVSSNHLQITYYLALLCAFLVLGFIIESVKEKALKPLLIAGGLALFGAGVAVMQSSAPLYSNYEMGKTSIRGKSRLTTAADGKKDKSDGLDQDYAFSWSYGINETFTILIPNFMGGESGGVLGKESATAKAFADNGYQAPNPLRTYTYWGDQPFTSGPVYFGAIICFLFVLSLFIVDNKYKWWLVGASAFFILLSWGRNCALNDFFFHYLPFYNKFRTPSMALVIPQLTFVILACMALKKIYDGEYDLKKMQQSINISAGITGGFCLIFWLMPSLFLSFECDADAQWKSQYPNWFFDALIQDREALTSSDALRSMLFILFATAVLYIVTKLKEQKYANYGIVAIAVLTLFDLWGVDRRYLNDECYVSKHNYNPFQETVADQSILQDKDLSYRVLTLNNPFNDTHISYYHKSIGGYNAAKLRDYQDLIDMRVEPEMQSVTSRFNTIKTQQDVDNLFTNTYALNMLNMRYLIYNDQTVPLRNTHALGNGWYVKDIKTVASSDEEMASLKDVNPGETAVLEKDMAKDVKAPTAFDAQAKVVMTHYAPDTLKYTCESKEDGVVLFSEVYYPHGWKAFVDGKEVNIFRSNWLLRGLQMPKGKHEVVFAFYPETYWTLRYIGAVLSYMLLIAVIGLIGFYFYKEKKNKENAIKN